MTYPYPIGDIEARQILNLDVADQSREVYEASKSYLPQYEIIATTKISHRLGYLPSIDTYKWHEFYIRELIHHYLSGGCIYYSEESFNDAVDIHIKHIRNADVQDIIAAPEYTREDIERYNHHLPEFKELAQKNIAYLMGYVPDLRYSLDAELYLRGFLASKSSGERNIITPVEYRTVNAISYREHFLKYGIEAANNSPIIGREWNAPFNYDTVE